MKIRVFLAFDISDKMRTELSSITTLLQGKAKNVKWVRPDKMHCTLHFFGNIEEDSVGKLSEIVEREVSHQAPMHFFGKGVGAFPNWRYPRVLWAGLSGETDAMASLHSRLEAQFGEFGFQRDPRALRLHLTLGRSRSAFKGCGNLMQLVEKLADREFGEIVVNSLVLYKSELTKEGSIYTVIKNFPFGGK